MFLRYEQSHIYGSCCRWNRKGRTWNKETGRWLLGKNRQADYSQWLVSRWKRRGLSVQWCILIGSRESSEIISDRTSCRLWNRATIALRYWTWKWSGKIWFPRSRSWLLRSIWDIWLSGIFPEWSCSCTSISVAWWTSKIWTKAEHWRIDNRFCLLCRIHRRYTPNRNCWAYGNPKG